VCSYFKYSLDWCYLTFSDPWAVILGEQSNTGNERSTLLSVSLDQSNGFAWLQAILKDLRASSFFSSCRFRTTDC